MHVVMDTNGTSGQNVGNIHPECIEAGISVTSIKQQTGPSAIHLDS